MKRILLITLMFYGLHTISFSQGYEYVPFPDSGAIWSEKYMPSDDMKPSIFERFILSGEDTIMNSKTYKKLFIFHDTIFDKSKDSCVGGIREDNQKRIFYKGNNIHELKPTYFFQDEILLYDFSLSVGDTFKDGNLTLEADYAIVSAIDTIQIGNSYRKKYHFDPYFWVGWIEGIGSVKGLLFTSGDLPTSSLNNDLICFKLHNEILYFNNSFSECLPVITSAVTKKNEFSIRVFPNPVKENSLLFYFGVNDYETIEIFDTNGILINRFNIWGKSYFVFSMEKLNYGIYFYKTTNKKGVMHTGKFVVQ